MAGGRKGQNSIPPARPDSYVHPSLQGRSAASSQDASAVSSSNEQTSSVNERLAHLRRTQGQRAPPATLFDTVRVGPHTISTPRESRPRATPGPPPPRSWTERKRPSTGPALKNPDSSSLRSGDLSDLPGIPLPSRDSLVHHSLVAIAADFDWHVAYDHVYLSVLPMRLKSLLLSYVAKYRHTNGISIAELRSLFATESETGLADCTGAEDLERLDLGKSLGHSFSLRELESYWFVNGKRAKLPSDSYNRESLPESWDAYEIPAALNSPLRFPNLTSLSLAFPSSKVSWSDFLQFSRHLGALTHLSLAKWPTPGLPSAPGVTLGMALEASRPRDILDMSDEERIWADATHLVKQLSRNTPSLQWLCLDGCHKWLPALRHACDLQSAFARAGSGFPRRFNGRRTVRERLADVDSAFSAAADDQSVGRDAAHGPPEAAGASPNKGGTPWTSSWRHLTTLVIRQESAVPAGIDTSVLRQLSKFQPARAAQAHDAAPRAHRARGFAGEAYSITTPCIQTSEQLKAKFQRDEWVRAEWEVFALAGAVNRTRVTQGLAVVAVDRGWALEPATGRVVQDLPRWEGRLEA